MHMSFSEACCQRRRFLLMGGSFTERVRDKSLHCIETPSCLGSRLQMPFGTVTKPSFVPEMGTNLSTGTAWSRLPCGAVSVRYDGCRAIRSLRSYSLQRHQDL